jgi:uncharacterized protein YidB (DUF937 family)
MALLDQVLGGLMGGMGGTGNSSSPLQAVLMNMLGGSQQGGMGMGGGLGGLLAILQQAGLGDVAQSWVGNGANQPIAPHQLQSAFGDEQVQSMAAQSGMAPHDFLAQLSQHLPNVVNGLTPNGRLPDEGTQSF